MHTIPVIDIGDFLAGGDGAAAASAIEHAAVEVGFFQIVNHGVPATDLDAVYDGMYGLADLPLDVREALIARTGHPFRGLHLNRDAGGEVRQQRFHAGRFDDADAAVEAGIPAPLADYYQPNSWPSEVPQFEPAVRNLLGRTQVLAGQMMRLFGIALGIGADGFAGVVEPNASTFAVNHYPARHAPLDKVPTVVFDEHADGNTLTILHQRGDYEGLEVQRLDSGDEWVPVPVRDDAFVINVGLLMTRWTNDHWPATRHRVVAAADPDAQRMTLTTFHMPALDTVIAPLPAWVGDDGPHYEPITPYEADRELIRRKYRAASETTHFDQKVYEYSASLAE